MTDERNPNATIELSQHEDGAHALMKPRGFLGGDLFTFYRKAIEGSVLDRTKGCNVALLDKVPTILKRLREADFDVEVTTELAASLQKHTAQLWSDLQGSNERADAIDAELKKGGLYLFPFQRIGVKWLATKHGALLADEMGLGKACPTSEPVLTPCGWKAMGDLRVGDQVIGANGRPTEVVGVFPQGERDIYRVTMTDGATTRCDIEHLWRVQTNNDRFRAARGQGHLVERVMTLGEILKAGLTMPGNTNRKWFVPMVKPVAFLARKLPVQPYLLGALLANGCMTGSSTQHSGTEEQRDQLLPLLQQEGVNLSVYAEYRAGLITRQGGVNPLTRKLQALGVRIHCHHKFVPEDYLFASVEDRLALLQGLFDNDGTVHKDGMCVEYNTTSHQLAKDVLHLARSLGGSAWMSTRIPKYEYLGEMKEGQLDHRIRISLPEGFLPFLVESKRAKYVPRSKYPPTHAIDSVVKEGREEAVCILVAAEDHLYVTNDFIVTHNTVEALAALPANAAVLVVAPAVAKGVWKREIARWRPNLDITVLSGRGTFRWPVPGEVVIINYDILPDMHEPSVKATDAKRAKRGCVNKLCKGCGPGLDIIASAPRDVVAIVDEAHALKNNKAKRTLKFRSLSEVIRGKRGRVWLLTATPLLNRPQELWSIYQAAGIAQEAFGSWAQFLKLFNGMPAFWGGYEWGTPEAECAERIRRVCLRRLRTEVLPELPVKTWRRTDVSIDAKTLKACDKLLKDYGGIKRILHLIENEGITFETMSSIRHALAVAKIPSLLSLIEQYEEQEEPVVVFSAHRAVVEELSKRPGWAVIMGGVKAEERTRIEEAFQAGKLKGVACTIAAGGVAITLTRSHNAIFTDLEWTPALNAQAEDRICVLHGQRVLTLRGSLLIEDVIVGDQVLTSEGRWSSVTAAWSRQHRGMMTEIAYTRFHEPLVTTHDHRVLVCRKDGSATDWVEAHEVLPGDFLVFPRMRLAAKPLLKLHVPESLRLPTIQKNQFDVTQENGRRKPLPEYLSVDDDLLKIFGWYLAEGFSSTKAGKGRFISFALNGFDEVDTGEWIVKFFRDKFGFNAHVNHREGALEIRIYSADLSFLFRHLFGGEKMEGASCRNIRIHPDIFTRLSHEQACLLLEGYMKGDGYARNRQQEWTSSSPSLAYQIATLCAAVGLNPGLREHGTTEGALVGCVISGGRPSNPALLKSDDVFVYHPVKSVMTRCAKRHKAQEMVRDLTVDTDESFTVGLATVHNCRIGQTRGCVITILQAEHELDERIIELLMHKQKLISETVDEARTPPSTTGESLDEEIVAMMAAAEADVRLAAEAEAREVEPAPQVPAKASKWRQPQTEQEEWGKRAILTLAGLDPDRASQQNEVGFSSSDGGIGHSLVQQLGAKQGLTNAQWSLTVKLCKKYWRQVGRCPGDEEQDAAQ